MQLKDNLGCGIEILPNDEVKITFWTSRQKKIFTLRAKNIMINIDPECMHMTNVRMLRDDYNKITNRYIPNYQI